MLFFQIHCNLNNRTTIRESVKSARHLWKLLQLAEDNLFQRYMLRIMNQLGDGLPHAHQSQPWRYLWLQHRFKVADDKIHPPVDDRNKQIMFTRIKLIQSMF